MGTSPPPGAPSPPAPANLFSGHDAQCRPDPNHCHLHRNPQVARVKEKWKLGREGGKANVRWSVTKPAKALQSISHRCGMSSRQAAWNP